MCGESRTHGLGRAVEGRPSTATLSIAKGTHTRNFMNRRPLKGNLQESPRRPLKRTRQKQLRQGVRVCRRKHT